MAWMNQHLICQALEIGDNRARVFLGRPFYALSVLSKLNLKFIKCFSKCAVARKPSVDSTISTASAG
jgi:hypothetical protein